MDESTKNQHFETIKEARNYLSTLPKRDISQSTLEEYQEVKNRIIGKDKYITNITLSNWRERPMAKSTFYKQRAALNYSLTEQLKKFLAAQDKAQRVGDYTLWERCMAGVSVTLKLMKENYFAPQLTVEEGLTRNRPREFSKIRKSKRSSLGSLPENWQEKVFNGMGRSKYKSALAVAWLSGSRPSEIKKGVKVSIYNNGEEKYLLFTVEGSKTGKDGKYGQKERYISVETTNPAAMLLLRQIEETDNKELIVSIETTEGFSQAVSESSKKVFPKRKEHVSPYSFRHSFSADVKSGVNELNLDEELSKELIAQALGHSSSDTQQVYGSSQQSKGSKSKVIVRGIKSGQVKPSRKRSKEFKEELKGVAKTYTR
jgi:integrase